MDRAGLGRRARGALRALRGTGADGPPAPPPLPDGLVAAPPDFVGVGTMKAGTTWWHKLLIRHPEVDRSGHKELHYFDAFCARPFTDADADAYARHFPRRPGRRCGEWTPRYMYDYWTPALLRRAAPDARLLVLLRDPVERYRSGLAHDLSRGRALDPELAQDHFARGLYHAQLRRLLEHFPAESLLVLQYERCVAEAEAELARTYEHLGVDPSFRPELPGRVLETKGPKPTIDDAATAALRDAYRADVAALATAFPEVDLDRWPHFAGSG